MPRPTPSALITAYPERPSLLPARIQKTTEQNEEEVFTVESIGSFESHVTDAPHWGSPSIHVRGDRELYEGD
jgi:hypothetical protein